MKRSVKILRSLVVAAAAAAVALTVQAVPVQAASETINGAGATFPYPVYAQWAYNYQKETGMQLNYQSIGSGGGIKQIKARTVDFGASDAPLKPEELNEAGLIQFPMIMGGVVPVVNIEGIKAGELRLSPEVLADIYLGKITKWNDAKIRGRQSGISSFPPGHYRGAPRRWLRDHLDLHQLPDQGFSRVGAEGRQRQGGAVAGRRRRQGERRGGRLRAADQRVHRLC